MMDYKEKFKEAKAFKVEGEFFKKYWRILKLARTPTREEFSKIAIVSATGIVLIGLVGFIIYEIMLILPN